MAPQANCSPLTVGSNDKLNYYKFGLGLGAATSDVLGKKEKAEGKDNNGEAGGAVEAAAGGADQ
jgi:hypothetical protein